MIYAVIKCLLSQGMPFGKDNSSGPAGLLDGTDVDSSSILSYLKDSIMHESNDTIGIFMNNFHICVM